MKVLLVGANGQVGKEVQNLAQKLNISLIPFGHENLDITNINSISNSLSPHQNATVLINAAAYTAVDMAEDEPDIAYQVNALGPKNLAAWCQKHNVPLIHISTDYVFSGDKTSAYLENDTPDPMSVYGETKLAGEQFVRDISPQHIILRVSWVFGQYGKNFVKTIIRLAKERETLKIVDDQIGNPTSAADIARVLLEIVQKISSIVPSPAGENGLFSSVPSPACGGGLGWGSYHYCGADTVSWYQFACAIIEEAQKYETLKVKEILPIATHEFPTKATRPKNSALNCDKITTLLEIPQKSWRGYLNELVEDLCL